MTVCAHRRAEWSPTLRCTFCLDCNTVVEKRANKFSAESQTEDGIRFQSKAEAKRYGDLKLMQLAGRIAELEVHPRYELIVDGARVQRYTADFRYLDVATGRHVVEDVKSPATAARRDWRRTKILMRACLGIDVQEVLR